MSQKGKKKRKQLSCKREANATKPWPDLPQQISNLMWKRWCFLLKSDGVTKSWRTPPRKCNPIGKSPWLQLSRTNDSKWKECHNTQSHISNISFRASNQQCMQFPTAIWFQGKFYALSLEGTLAILEGAFDSHPRITATSKSRAVPSTLSRHFREYLVEFNGEILLIFLVSRKSTNVVDDVEVFRLHFADLSWVKMGSIGDQTIIAGPDWFISVDASKLGCRSNCIYFSHHTDDGWCVYDVEKGSLSPANICFLNVSVKCNH